MSTQQLIDVSATCRFPEYEDLFRKNGSEYFSQLDGGAAIYEQLLMDLFRTEFHVKLLWGSGSGVQEFPQNFEIRHSKFSKVIHTLVAICTKTWRNCSFLFEPDLFFTLQWDESVFLERMKAIMLLGVTWQIQFTEKLSLMHTFWSKHINPRCIC